MLGIVALVRFMSSILARSLFVVWSIWGVKGFVVWGLVTMTLLLPLLGSNPLDAGCVAQE